MQGIKIKLDPEAHITHILQHTYINTTLHRLHPDIFKPLRTLIDDTATDALMTALHSAKVKHFNASQDCTQNEGECHGMQSWAVDCHT
jgi:hypothetical protein